MQTTNDYYFDPSPVNNFNNLCHDISTRRRFHDLRSFTILVVDQFLNSMDIDLCQINYKQVDLGKFDYLIGLNSEVFKCICSDDLLFRNFLYALIDHCKKSRVSIPVFVNSLYFRYFSEVLTYLLPTSDTSLLSLKKFDWFCAINKHSAAKSALRLLKPQVIAASYSPDLFAHTDGFSSLYPRVYEFCNFAFERLVERTLLYENQLITLKHFVLHYVSFLLAPTADPDFASFKQRLSSQNSVVKYIKPWLQRRLQNSALDYMYEELVDFWLSLVVPSDKKISENRETMAAFVNNYSKEFVEILFIVIERCRNVDLTLASHINFVSYVVNCVFAPEMCQQYQLTMGIEPDDYLTEIQNKIQIHLQASEAHEQEKLQIPVQYKLAKLFGFFQNIVAAPQGYVKQLKAIMDTLNKKLGARDLSQIQASPNNNSNSCLNGTHLTGSTSSISSFNPKFNSTPIRNQTPEHKTDPITKLYYLTPEGRKQVIRRQAQFDFSQCSATMSRVSPNAGPWENEYMVKIFQKLSEKYSNSAFTHYLRMNNGRTRVATFLSKIFLSNPYAHRYVPVYSRNIVDKLPQLNLRFMASYPFLVIATIQDQVWIIPRVEAEDLFKVNKEKGYLSKLFSNAEILLPLKELPLEKKNEFRLVYKHFFPTRDDWEIKFVTIMKTLNNKARQTLFKQIKNSLGYAITDLGYVFYYKLSSSRQIECYPNPKCFLNNRLVTRSFGNMRIPRECIDFTYILVIEKTCRQAKIRKVFADGTTLLIRG